MILKAALSSLAALVAAPVFIAEAGAAQRPNVLIISVDDLRPELGTYGVGYMRTPRMDALAAQGARFDRAYAAQAVCVPSRISFFTGMRPDSTGVHDIWTDFRNTIPDAVTMSQHFRAAGYHTVGMGKVLHTEKPAEWDDYSWATEVREYHDPKTLAMIEAARIDADARGLKDGERFRALLGPAWEIVPDALEGELRDAKLTDRAIRVVEAERDKPFFMVVGYFRPHLPFVAPQRHWDMYPAEQTELPHNYRTGAPTAPPIALIDWGELRAYKGIPATGPVSDEEAINLIRGYRATVSFVDHQIGRLLDALERTGRDRDTLVVLWGDHGYKTGEYGMWAKHTNFEIDARVPLIIRVPAAPAGLEIGAPVELIDVFATVSELAGLPVPTQNEGTSLVPWLRGETPEGWRTFARSQYIRERRTGGNIMGYSMRTVDHRYTEWINQVTGVVVARELYDHSVDPWGDHNLAGDPAQAALMAELSTKLTASRSGAGEN